LKYGGEIPIIEINAEIESNFVKYSVMDNGFGISQEDINNIYTNPEKIEASKIKGTGIGLSIVKQIIVKLNGTINIDKNPKRGSIFSFILPAI